MTRIALVDVDGTLVDTNYQHTIAWARAFRRVDITVPLWRIHRHNGMGGDQLVGAVAGAEVEERHGDMLREAWKEEFDPFLPEIAPVEGAHDLLAGMQEVGVRVVLASSGKPDHVKIFMDLVKAHDVIEAWTTSEDVERTKPHPDLLEVALAKLAEAGTPAGDEDDIVMIGDSVWDCAAAARLGARSLAVRIGGFGREELLEAGADDVFDTLAELGAAMGARRS